MDTFDHKIELSEESVDKLIEIFSDEKFVKPINVSPYPEKDKEYSDTLLNLFLSHCKNEGE